MPQAVDGTEDQHRNAKPHPDGVKKWGSIDALERDWQQGGNVSESDKKVIETLRTFDTDGNGIYSLSEVVHISEIAVENAKISAGLQQANRDLRKLTLALTLTLLLLLASMFVVAYGAVALQKDAHVDATQSSIMRSNDGNVVKTGSTDIVVKEGMLIAASDDAKACVSADACDKARRLREEELIPLAVREAPLEQAKLSSTAPDSVLNELKSLKLTNLQGDSVTLNVVGWLRKRQHGSKCGSVVNVNTLRGSFTLDDYDIILSADLRTSLLEEGFTVIEDEDLSAGVGGRRLSEGHSIAGLFRFAMQYDWKCESFEKPLEHLKPPYMYVIETHVPCPDECKSEIFPGSPLPGRVMENKRPFIAKKETIYAFEKVIFSTQEFRSHPGMTLRSVTDLATGTKRQQTVTNDVVHDCSISQLSTEDIGLRQYESMEIVVVGSVQQGNRTFRRYQVLPNTTANEATERSKSVEFWEDSVTDAPYKYFLPYYPLSSISYFKDFRQNVEPGMSATLASAFYGTCHQSFGPNITKDGLFQENEDTLKFFRDALKRNEITLDDVDPDDLAYWKLVRRAEFESDTVPSGVHYEDASLMDDASNSSLVGEDRRLQTHNRWCRKFEVGKKSNTGFWSAKQAEDAIKDGAKGDEMSFVIQLCLTYGSGTVAQPNGVAVWGLGKVQVPIPPIFFLTMTAGGSLELKLMPADKIQFGGRVHFAIGAGVDLGIAKCNVEIGGQIYGGTDGRDKWGYVTGQVAGTLFARAACWFFGLQLGPAIMGSITTKFGKLGGHTTADDYVTVKGRLEFAFYIFIFKISFPWDFTLLPPTPIGGVDLNDVSKVAGSWTKKCACGGVFTCHLFYIQNCDNWEVDVPPEYRDGTADDKSKLIPLAGFLDVYDETPATDNCQKAEKACVAYDCLNVTCQGGADACQKGYQTRCKLYTWHPKYAAEHGQKTTNIARARSVTGSSFFPGYGSFEGAVDGDYASHWHAGYGDRSTGSWLAVDLGDVNIITGMYIQTTGHSSNFNFRKLTTYQSIGGTNDAWNLVRTEDFTDTTAGRGTNHAGWDEPTQSIKIEMRDRVGGDYFALAEWEVYGYKESAASAVNIALRREVSGSSDSGWGRFPGATDGDYDNHWHAGSGDRSVGSWLSVDLIREFTITGMSLEIPKHSGNYNARKITTYRLESEQWILVRTENFPDARPGRRTLHAGWDEPTRSIKIELNDRVGGDFFALSEWEVYGYETSTWPTEKTSLKVKLDQEPQYCNSGDYEMFHYDWGDKVDCPHEYKRCFCRKKSAGVTGEISNEQNLALHQPVIGSSDSGWGRFSGATDGNYDSHWHSEREGQSWLAVEFKRMSTVRSMLLQIPGHSGNYAFKNLVTYRSSVQGDTGWTFVRSESFTETNAGRRTSHEGWSEPTFAVKILLQNKAGGDYFALAEWEVHGDRVFGIPVENWFCAVVLDDGVLHAGISLESAQAVLGPTSNKNQAVIPMTGSNAGDPHALPKSWKGGNMLWSGWPQIREMQAMCMNEDPPEIIPTS